MYNTPVEDKNNPRGFDNLAELAGPASPSKPVLPTPAIVETIPEEKEYFHTK